MRAAGYPLAMEEHPEASPDPEGSRESAGPTSSPGPGEENGSGEPERRLRRSRSDRVLGGVFGGLGPYLGIDPVVLRVAWAALTVVSFGTGIVAYAVAWIVIPEARRGRDPKGSARTDRDAGRLVIGVVFLVMGLGLLAREVFPRFVDLAFLRRALAEAGDVAGPLILIALGVAVLVVGARRR